MKNTIMNYDTETVDFDTSIGEVYARDYFSKEIHISDILSSIDTSEYLDTYKLLDDDKIERISYELYGTTDYWDILMLLNNSDPIFSMSYNYDIITSSSTSFLDIYINDIYQPTPLSDTKRISELTKEFTEMMDLENEQNRYIKIVKPSKMNDFILLLKAEGYL